MHFLGWLMGAAVAPVGMHAGSLVTAISGVAGAVAGLVTYWTAPLFAQDGTTSSLSGTGLGLALAAVLTGLSTFIINWREGRIKEMQAKQADRRISLQERDTEIAETLTKEWYEWARNISAYAAKMHRTHPRSEPPPDPPPWPGFALRHFREKHRAAPRLAAPDRPNSDQQPPSRPDAEQPEPETN